MRDAAAMEQCKGYNFQLRQFVPTAVRYSEHNRRWKIQHTSLRASTMSATPSTSTPTDLPHVDEVGLTSGPLKSAAFFIGAYCKEYNGSSVI